MSQSNSQYITVPIETSPDELAQLAYNRLEELVDGWEPHDGNGEVIVIEAIATMMAEGRDVASAVPLAIFRYFGQSVMKIPPINAVSATVLTDWKFSDGEGHTIEAGAQVVISNEEGENFPFQVVSEVSCAAGSTEIKGIALQALIAGAESSGLQGKIEQASSLNFVETISYSASTPETSGGTDEESDTAYVNRLASQLSLLSPRPIVPRDFSRIAPNIEGVYRALALNGYDAIAKTFNNEKTITVVPLQENGTEASAEAKTKLLEYLQELREVNWNIYIIAPTITSVDTEITVHAAEGQNAALIKEAVKSAITTFLEGRNWGFGPVGTGGQGIPVWINEPEVRQASIAAVAARNIGVTYPLLPKICETGKALENKDFKLPGVAPLPKAGTVTVNVVIP